jgi:hypothetical protein
MGQASIICVLDFPSRAQVVGSGGCLACRRAGASRPADLVKVPIELPKTPIVPNGETRALYGRRDARRYSALLFLSQPFSISAATSQPACLAHF